MCDHIFHSGLNQIQEFAEIQNCVFLILSRFPVPVQPVQFLYKVLKVCAARPVASDIISVMRRKNLP